jgi:hypothetical protein
MRSLCNRLQSLFKCFTITLQYTVTSLLFSLNYLTLHHITSSVLHSYPLSYPRAPVYIDNLLARIRTSFQDILTTTPDALHKIKIAFAEADKDSKNTVNAAELQEIFITLGLALASNEIRALQLNFNTNARDEFAYKVRVEYLHSLDVLSLNRFLVVLRTHYAIFSLYYLYCSFIALSPFIISIRAAFARCVCVSFCATLHCVRAAFAKHTRFVCV